VTLHDFDWISFKWGRAPTALNLMEMGLEVKNYGDRDGEQRRWKWRCRKIEMEVEEDRDGGGGR
jgi:hypothetical protein